MVKPLFVLVAEDNAVNQLVARALLERRGHTVVVCGDGLRAVEAVQDAGVAFDLVLMDIHMPELDGIGAAAAIREHEVATGRAPVPIVALTADDVDSQRGTYLAAGMQDVLRKPIDVPRLEALLEGIGGGAAP